MREIKKRKDHDIIVHSPPKEKVYLEKITIRLNIFLIEKIKNIVISNKLGGNYKYATISDLVRSALEKYKDGAMTLINQPLMQGEKKETSFKLSKELKNFYTTLPNNAKSEIFEKVIVSYINNM